MAARTGQIAQRQVLAKISPIEGANDHVTGPGIDLYFAQVSGGEVTASVEKIYIGGEKFPSVLCAPAEIGDLTVTAHYDLELVSTLSALRQAVGRTYYSVSIYGLNCDLVSKQTMRQYPRCLLVGLTEPEGDASSGAPATFTLTFAVSGAPTPYSAPVTTPAAAPTP